MVQGSGHGGGGDAGGGGGGGGDGGGAARVVVVVLVIEVVVGGVVMGVAMVMMPQPHGGRSSLPAMSWTTSGRFAPYVVMM